MVIVGSISHVWGSFHCCPQMFVTYITVATNIFFVTGCPHNFSPIALVAIKACLEAISSHLDDVEGFHVSQVIGNSPSMSTKLPKVASKHVFMVIRTIEKKVMWPSNYKINICGHNNISYKHL